ncbi:MAG: transglycosylase SLT domain-containing protein [Candidatus Competibacteraceae bacterium]
MNNIVFNRKPVYLAIYWLLLNLWLPASNAASPETPFADIQAAVERMRAGYNTEALQKLQAIMVADPNGRIGDQAALMLGNFLIQQRRPVDALTPLRRAVNGKVGSVYARYLLARAVIEGEVQASFPEAHEQLTYLLQENDDEITPILREQATFLQINLYSLEKRWGEAANVGQEFLDRWPSSQLKDEAYWLTAEALYQAGRFQEAYSLYATIWYKTPHSTWALEAKDKLHQLEITRNLPPQHLTLQEHYGFIKALQRVGLHKEALEEIEVFIGQYPQDAKVADVLLMKAESLYKLRRDTESIAMAETLRRRYPHSPQIAGTAAIYAIKCLRRTDNTPEIRRWASWVIKSYPHSQQSTEARYELGGHLGNLGNAASAEEGIEVLQQLLAQGTRQQGLMDDALWKIAWMQRRLERIQDAKDTLETLLRDYPDSGFRQAALYWAARFGSSYNQEKTVEYYQTLLRDFPNDYYGYLALDNLLNLGIKPRQIGNLQAFPPVDFLDKANRPNAPVNYFRAVNLKSIGLYNFAAAEIESIPGVESDLALQFSLADLYANSGNTGKAITILEKHFKNFMVSEPLNSKLIPSGFWQIAYPFHYRREIETALKEAKLSDTRIDPYLMAALIRMESRFMPTAISPLGAIGLMQLMPDTVEKMAKQTDSGHITRTDLFDPATNIHFGTLYLAQRVNDFGRSWFPAICSYNAGTEPVRKWLQKRPPDQPQDEFIETIPYHDTRIYIKKILGDYKNYQRLYPEGDQ